jgi:phosphate transport system substrate-binding protein
MLHEPDAIRTFALNASRECCYKSGRTVDTISVYGFYWRGPMAKSLRLLRGLCSFLFLTFASSQSATAQQPTVFCLNDGTQISVEKFETRDGKFLLYVPGAPRPLEYPSSSVKGINVKCEPTEAPPKPAAQSSSNFGIHGSNTIGERLMPMLIEAFGAKKLGAKPTSKLGASEEQEFSLKSPSGAVTVVDLKAHGSGTSAKDMIDGKSIIGMSSRRINPEETAAFTAKFNTNPQLPASEHVLALDGVAVIVNAANPVTELSLDQIGKIFAGHTTRWSEVGGANRGISVFRRDDQSGTTDTFKSLVLNLNKLNFSAGVSAFESSETVSSKVAADPDAIGFVGLPYINRNRALAITSSCGINSSPSRFTVKTEIYPLARRLYLYTIGVPADPIARDLLQFALSDEAQPIVQETEFVDQTIDLQDDGDQQRTIQDIVSNPSRGLLPDKDVPRDALRSFEALLATVHRTSLTFRFEQGSADLDTRAQQDVGRLVRYLASPVGAGKKFYIAGFGDVKGDWTTNRSLGFKRALRVADELERVGGIHVSRENVLSMSYMAPVACSDNDAGLAKNRRVEIWIAR